MWNRVLQKEKQNKPKPNKKTPPHTKPNPQTNKIPNQQFLS